MVSKAKIKLVKSLENKKYRDQFQVFIAEGNKLVSDMIQEFDCEWMLAKTSWLATQGNLPVKELVLAEDDDISKISLLKNPQDVFAILKKPVYEVSEIAPTTQLVLALDGIQDPGNLGTMIRIADWFGIEHVICSLDTADAFSPKAVQAAMGALGHVKIHYLNLEEYLNTCQAPIYGTFLNGENIYQSKLTSFGIVIMGNEGNGIQKSIEKHITQNLFIPNYPTQSQKTSESLNVAMATAIVCSEFRRRQI